MNTTTNYRRKYVNMALSNGADKFSADTISVTHDIDANSAYAKFEAPTRLSILKAALYQAIVENTRVARFGLVRMRQRTPVTSATIGNSGPVTDANVLQQGAGITTDRPDGKWNISRPTVSQNNGAQGQPAANSLAIVQADSSTANSDLQTALSHD